MSNDECRHMCRLLQKIENLPEDTLFAGLRKISKVLGEASIDIIDVTEEGDKTNMTFYELKNIFESLKAIEDSATVDLLDTFQEVFENSKRNFISAIKKKVDISTKVSYNCNKFSQRIEDGIARSTDNRQYFNATPMYTSLLSGAVVPIYYHRNSFLVTCQVVCDGIIGLVEYLLDSPKSHSCLDEKIIELQRVYDQTTEIEELYKGYSGNLEDLKNSIVDIISKMYNSSMINKEISKEVYEIFLDDYLKKASENESHLLNKDVEKMGIATVRRLIKVISGRITNKDIENFLKVEFSKEFPDSDIVSVLIANSSTFNVYESMNYSSNAAKKLLEESYYTGLFRAHETIFGDTSMNSTLQMLFKVPEESGKYSQVITSDTMIFLGVGSSVKKTLRALKVLIAKRESLSGENNNSDPIIKKISQFMTILNFSLITNNLRVLEDYQRNAANSMFNMTGDFKELLNIVTNCKVDVKEVTEEFVPKDFFTKAYEKRSNLYGNDNSLPSTSSASSSSLTNANAFGATFTRKR